MTASVPVQMVGNVAIINDAKPVGVSVTYAMQCAQLPAIKEDRPEFKEIYSQVLQDVLKRVEQAFKAYFKRSKEGKTPGYPRFQGYDRYDSFTYPQIEKLKGKPTMIEEALNGAEIKMPSEADVFKRARRIHTIEAYQLELGFS